MKMTLMTHNVRIQVDDRELRSLVPELLRGQDGVEVEVRRLAIGDYKVENAVIVERKTLADFAASVISGRLFKQLGWLASCDLQPALILEGASSEAARLGVSREALQGALVSATVIFGLPVLRAGTPAETAQLLRYMAGQIGRITRCGVTRGGWKPRSNIRRQLYILQGLPGIGPERARRLLERFGHVRGVVNATPQALAEVEGIGAATAAGIEKVLSGK